MQKDTASAGGDRARSGGPRGELLTEGTLGQTGEGSEYEPCRCLEGGHSRRNRESLRLEHVWVCDFAVLTANQEFTGQNKQRVQVYEGSILRRWKRGTRGDRTRVRERKGPDPGGPWVPG